MLKDIDTFVEEQYKPAHSARARDWRTYEQQWECRIKNAVAHLRPLIDEATVPIISPVKTGPEHKLSLYQRVMLLLVQRWCKQSNRITSCFLTLFGALSGADISYKTVERLYSDQDVILALLNLHVLILKKQDVHIIRAAGDATGYGLTITKHYATEAQKLKDGVKTQMGTRKFVYVFRLLDLNSSMYVTQGTSFTSEKDAFDQAMRVLHTLDISIDSLRLDKYYSAPHYIDQFPDTTIFVIPKKNATLNGSWHWKRTIIRMHENLMHYLEEYYQRNHVETEIKNDKQHFGWQLPQRRDDRIDTATQATMNLHNLLKLTTEAT